MTPDMATAIVLLSWILVPLGGYLIYRRAKRPARVRIAPAAPGPREPSDPNGLGAAIGTFVAFLIDATMWLLWIGFWVALAGGSIYGLVRFVRWAWYN